MFARHDLVWLTSRGWQRVRADAPAAPDNGIEAALDAWRDAGWPAVVRRTEANLPPGAVAIGFALPPRTGSGIKPRIGCVVELADIGRRTRALPLVGALDAAPEAWRAGLATLERQAAEAGLGLAAYGSLALQALTGQRYLTAASDIDVLLRPLNRAQLMAGLELLARHASSLPLDGEVVFPDGRAVAWKELRAAFGRPPGTRVLAKALEQVALASLDELLATLEEPAWLN